MSPTAPLWHHTCTLPLFVGANNEALWQAFLSFLAGLGFLQRWTATMEESTNAQEVGRIHLHVFVEFKQPVDWTSLELVNTRLFREAAITAPIIKAHQIWHPICRTTQPWWGMFGPLCHQKCGGGNSSTTADADAFAPIIYNGSAGVINDPVLRIQRY